MIFLVRQEPGYPGDTCTINIGPGLDGVAIMAVSFFIGAMHHDMGGGVSLQPNLCRSLIHGTDYGSQNYTQPGSPIIKHSDWTIKNCHLLKKTSASKNGRLAVRDGRCCVFRDFIAGKDASSVW